MKAIINYIKLLASLPAIVADLEDENQALRGEIRDIHRAIENEAKDRRNVERNVASEIEDVKIDIHELAETVEEMPSQDKVEELIEREVNGLDIGDAIRDELRDWDFSDDIEDAIGNSKLFRIWLTTEAGIAAVKKALEPKPEATQLPLRGGPMPEMGGEDRV